MRTTVRSRQHMAKGLAIGALLIVASMLLAPIASAGTPSQWGVSWDYRLLGKLNSASDPAPDGLTIVITGSGSFDLSQLPQPTIDGGGDYIILDKGGGVVGSGTWEARTFKSFTPMSPGNSPGEGGHLELMADFKGPLSGSQLVVVQCSMWGPTVGPPGYPWPPDYVEVGPYTVHETGAVMFNLNQ